MILNDVQNFIKPSRTISQAQITTMVNTTNPKDPEENNSIENEVATSLEVCDGLELLNTISL